MATEKGRLVSAEVHYERYHLFPFGSVSRGSILAVRILNFLFVCGVFAVNALATLLPLNGVSTGSVSDNNPTYFTPAGYAFTIWSVIYVFLAVFIVYQVVPRTFTSRPVNEAYSIALIINASCNIGWIFAWHWNQLDVSLGIMYAIFLTLLFIKLRLTPFLPATWVEYICVQVPISLYLGWITCASVVNTIIVIPGLADSMLAAQVGMGVAAAIGVFVILYHRDPVVGGVVVWALVAISQKQRDYPEIYWVALGIAIGVGALSGLVWLWNIISLIRGRRKAWSVQPTDQFVKGAAAV